MSAPVVVYTGGVPCEHCGNARVQWRFVPSQFISVNGEAGWREYAPTLMQFVESPYGDDRRPRAVVLCRDCAVDEFGPDAAAEYDAEWRRSEVPA